MTIEEIWASSTTFVFSYAYILISVMYDCVDYFPTDFSYSTCRNECILCILNKSLKIHINYVRCVYNSTHQVRKYKVIYIDMLFTIILYN